MSRPKPTVLLTISNKETYKQEEVLAAEGIWAVFYDGKPINLKSSSLVSNYPGPKYKKVSFSNPGHAENLVKKTERETQDKQVRSLSIKNWHKIQKIINCMDTKTAYTRTFMMMLEQKIHDETIKTNYYTWWQNVRESYQARSLRLTKIGLQVVKDLDIKTYEIKFPDKIIFTPQTYLWLDEFVDCPYFVDKKHIVVTMEKMALQLMMFAGDITKYGLARAMSKIDDQRNAE